VVTRMNDMHPQSSANLEMFLKFYEAAGSYVLIPGVMSPGGTPSFATSIGLRKRVLIVKQACEIGAHDIEQVAIGRLARR